MRAIRSISKRCTPRYQTLFHIVRYLRGLLAAEIDAAGQFTHAQDVEAVSGMSARSGQNASSP